VHIAVVLASKLISLQGASGRGGVGNNYLKVMGKIVSSSATKLSPDNGYMASSSVIPIEPPARPARPQKKGKVPELPIALNDMAHVPYSPSGSEDIALPPAPPPTATSVTRSLSDSDIPSSMHTGSAAYTAGGGSSHYADDRSSFAESTWSFHVTRARPPQANSLAPLRVSSSFAATATAHTAGAPNERTYERPLSIRSVGTFGVPKRKAAVAGEGGDSPTFRASTPEDDDDEDDEDIGRSAYLPSLAVDEEDEDISDDDHTHAFVYLLPPAVQGGITASHHRRWMNVRIRLQHWRWRFLVALMVSPQPDRRESACWERTTASTLPSPLHLPMHSLVLLAPFLGHGLYFLLSSYLEHLRHTLSFPLR
jgi:hypothetical protein